LILSQVHPDLLPSLYSVAEVLRGHGTEVHLITFASPAGVSPSLREGVALHDCGPMAGNTLARRHARTRFRRTLDGWMREHEPRAIIVACPFGYLEALRVRSPATPVVFMYYEMYDARLRDFHRSPATIYRNWTALRRLTQASLVCTPSVERAAWLLARADLRRLPDTVLNSPSLIARTASAEIPLSSLLPPSALNKPLVINTGGVTESRCVKELVASVANWRSDAALVVTNVGDSPYAREVRDVAGASPRRDAVVLLPLIPRGEMIALQRAASVGISLLRGEDLDTMLPAPNKIAEYVHAGLLVVASRSSFTERIADRGVAVLAESLRPEDLAASIDSAVSRSLGGVAREQALRAAQQWYCMDVQLSPVLRALGYA
jgi:hypothetical protein